MTHIRRFFARVFNEIWCILRLTLEVFGFHAEFYIGNTLPGDVGLQANILYHVYNTSPDSVEASVLLGPVTFSLSISRSGF